MVGAADHERASRAKTVAWEAACEVEVRVRRDREMSRASCVWGKSGNRAIVVFDRANGELLWLG